jgi:hypothetical protein
MQCANAHLDLLFGLLDVALAFLIERAGERRTGKLRALVGIEDVRFAVTSQSILQRFDAERRLHGD